MDISPREKERRQQIQRRRQKRRQLMVYGAVFVLLTVTALGFILKGVADLITTGSVADESAPTVTTAAPTTTTTTTAPYPTLPAATVSGQVSSRAVLLYDATHDTVLYRSNTAGELLYPASITKLLTAIVACETGIDPGTNFTVGREVALAQWDASKAYLLEGVEYTFTELLEALLLESGADAAYCLAVNVARIRSGDATLTDEQAVALFMTYMNETAQKIGTVNSYFVTPDGYHDMYHHSTADDLLKIALYADEIPLIRSCVAASATTYFQNTNALLHSDSVYYYPYATGMKTGSTDEAGYCLAASAEKDGVRLYAILLAAETRGDTFNDAKALFEMGFALAEEQQVTTGTLAIG